MAGTARCLADGIFQWQGRVDPQFAVQRESTGLGVLFILVKLSFLWEIGGRRGPPDKGLL